MKIEELKEFVDAVAELHPGFEVDFLYPSRRGEKETTKLGKFQGYRSMQATKILRIVVY